MPFHIGNLSREELDAVYAVREAKSFAVSEVQKAVAALKATPIGKAVTADIDAMTSKSMSGAEKMATVVANTVPLIVTYLGNGGIKAVEADVLSIAKELSQSVFDDFASTSAGKVAQQVLGLFRK